MTPPKPNTPEEQEWFAREEMGWKHLCDRDSSNDWPCFGHNIKDEFIVWRNPNQPAAVSVWNPRISIADAVELAEKLNLEVNRSPSSRRWFAVGWVETFHSDGNPRDAICEAAREKLAKEVKDAG